MKSVFKITILLCILNLLSLTKVDAQHLHYEIDTLYVPSDTMEITHLPRRATMFSAVLPGLGQVYNGSWWKVPIIYGGFTACGIGISWNQNLLKDARQAYFDLDDNNPETKSYETLFAGNGYDFDNASQVANIKTILKNGITNYRRQRDLIVIATIGVYLFNILDANVEAHFIDFDISEDLTLNIKPYTIEPLSNKPIFGAEFAIRF